MSENMKFEILANSIKEINDKACTAAKRAVNQTMTLRNWAIGYYIVEYEQGGSDRAEYGANLLKNLEKQIDEKGMNVTLFKSCRQFYLVYPQIGSTVSNLFSLPDSSMEIVGDKQYKSIVFFNLFNIYFYHIKYAKNPLFMGFFLILPLRILFINVINCSLLI